MSWILAAINAPANVCESARGLVNQTPSLLCQTGNNNSFFAAGGIPETCHFKLHQQGHTGWIVVGLGLDLQGPSCTPVDSQAWEAILAANPSNTFTPPLLPANGHYAALRWQDNAAEAFTDALGVRTLYYTTIAEGLILSTRLDWIARLSGHRNIDYATFASHWLTFNQLTFDSPVQHIHRLGSGGRLKYDAGRVSANQTPWRPEETPYRPAAFSDTLQAFCNPVLPVNKKLSLGLSGGLDSRTLLALMDNQRAAGVHTFGPPEKEDVKIARNIASGLGLQHLVLHDSVPLRDQCLKILRLHVAQTGAMTSASAVLGLQHYHELRERNLAIIDGGFGEASRRQFLNRLLRRGASHFNNKPLDQRAFTSFLPLIATPRADIFSAEVQSEMEAGVINQLEKVWSELPTVEEFGLENVLDLLSTRTRLPNFFGFEQNRLDGLILNYMPFAQPDLLKQVFNTPVEKRKEGRLFRQIIKTRRNELTRYPLVKGAYTYPFRLNATGAFVWTKIKMKVKPAPVFPLQHQFLDAVQEFVMDTLASNEVSEYAPYNLHKIRSLVASYYAGSKKLASFVDWWLSFEVWRQEIQKKTV